MNNINTLEDIKKEIKKTKDEIVNLEKKLEDLSFSAQELCEHKRLLVTTIKKKDGSESFKNVCPDCGRISGTPSHEEIMKFIGNLSFS